MSWKYLAMGLWLICTALSAAAVEGVDICDAKLGTGRYYGAFVKGLSMGALTDGALAKSAQSETPYHPLRNVTPTPAQSQAKHLFDTLVEDPDVIAQWPHTRAQLTRLLDLRTGLRAVEKEASHVTRDVLNPQVQVQFKSRYPDAPIAQLDDGTVIIAHFVGKRQFAVTRLEDQVDIVPTEDLPSQFEKPSDAHLSFHRDLAGKLWLYLSVSDFSKRATALFKREWGTRAWQTVEIFPSDFTIAGLHSPWPGSLLVKATPPSQTPTVFDIGGGEAVTLKDVPGLAHGDFVRDQDGAIVGPNSGKANVASVYRSSKGLVRYHRHFTIEWNGEFHPLSGFPDRYRDGAGRRKERIVDVVNFGQVANGDAYVAVIYHAVGPGPHTLSIWRMGTFDAPVYSVDLPGWLYTGTRFVEDRDGKPLFAMNVSDGNNARLVVIDPLGQSARVDMPLAGSIGAWSEIGDEYYFNVHNGSTHELSIYKLFTPTPGARGPSSENSGDACEAKLGGRVYYEAFLKGLTMGALTDDHLEQSVGSDKPFHPLRHVTPLPVQSAAKHLFDTLVTDQSVIEHWPETRQALARLLELRRGRNKVAREAEEATRHVLAPQVYLRLDSYPSSSAAPLTLDDGSHVILHFDGPDKFAVTRLADKSKVATADLPARAKSAHHRELNWLRDKDGRLWIYLAVNKLPEGPRAYKQEWGTSTWTPLELNQTSLSRVKEFLSPAPGVQWLRLDDSTGEPVVLDLTAGVKPVGEEQGIRIRRFQEGSWVRQADGKFLFPDRVSVGFSWIFDTQSGPLRLVADENVKKLTFAQNGVVQELPLPPNFGGSRHLAFREMPDGKKLVALLYTPEQNPNGFDGLAVWRIDNGPRLLWSHEAHLATYASLRWIQNAPGSVLLAIDSLGRERVRFVDPLNRALLEELELAGDVAGWFEIGGETYFKVVPQNAAELLIYKVFADPKGGG